MPITKQQLASSALVLTMVLGSGVALPVTAAAKPACASELGLSVPTAADAAAKTPVILVHGLWSKASDLAKLESRALPASTAPYRFDYEETNDKWVTTGDTAHHLAKTIVCYSRLYGNKDAAIVAHSMGGLLTREALSWAAYGTKAKDATGHVVTIGTPNKGAPMGGASFISNISLCNATFVWWGEEAADAATRSNRPRPFRRCALARMN
jgi:triacylglycerol esterase/lipase EstA (alpha/beta hydrolase family)